MQILRGWPTSLESADVILRRYRIFRPEARPPIRFVPNHVRACPDPPTLWIATWILMASQPCTVFVSCAVLHGFSAAVGSFLVRPVMLGWHSLHFESPAFRIPRRPWQVRRHSTQRDQIFAVIVIPTISLHLSFRLRLSQWVWGAAQIDPSTSHRKTDTDTDGNSHNVFDLARRFR